jgi:hypothetical protein
MFTGLQTPLNGTANEETAQTTTAMSRIGGQPSQAKTRHRIARRFLLGAFIQLNRIDLSGAQTVVAQ